jgi:enolase
MATLLDLLNELDMNQNEIDEILYDYQGTITPSELGVSSLFGKSITTKQQMDALLDSINDGVIRSNPRGLYNSCK